MAANKTDSVTNSSKWYHIAQIVKRHGMLYDAEAMRSLVAWLRREDTTNKQDLRTPIFRNLSRQQIIDMVMGIVKSDVPGCDPHLLAVLRNVEEGQAGKISVQSAYQAYSIDGPKKVARIMSDKKLGNEINWEALARAERDIIDLFAPKTPIRQKDWKSAILGESGSGADPGDWEDQGMDLDTNFGPPLFTSYWWPKEGMSGRKLYRAERAKAYLLQVMPKYLDLFNAGHPVDWWAIQGKRLSQSDKPDKRKRIVIAMPKPEAIAWKTITPALIQHLITVKYGDIPPTVAWTDQPNIALYMQKMLETAHKAGRIIVSGDLSNFDATIPPELMIRAGNIIAKWVYNGEKFVNSIVESLTNRVTLITPDKIWRAGSSSMKSGSGGTNLLDTIINLLVLFYGMEMGWYKIANVAAQGDDFIIDGDGVEPKVIEHTYGVFGMEANESKQMVVPNALSYLQLIHYRGYLGGIGSVARIWGHAVSYERMKKKAREWSGWVDVVATISKLEVGAFSPWFERSVKELSLGDKFHLGANLDPNVVLERSGSTGKEIIQQDLAASWKSGEDPNGFASNAVNGVLRGEVMPPLGSKERFLRVYRKRAEIFM